MYQSGGLDTRATEFRPSAPAAPVALALQVGKLPDDAAAALLLEGVIRAAPRGLRSGTDLGADREIPRWVGTAMIPCQSSASRSAVPVVPAWLRDGLGESFPGRPRLRMGFRLLLDLGEVGGVIPWRIVTHLLQGLAPLAGGAWPPVRGPGPPG
jgi:hypothetical protein